MFKVLKKKESFGIHGHALTSLNNTAGLCIYCNTTKHTMILIQTIIIKNA